MNVSGASKRSSTLKKKRHPVLFSPPHLSMSSGFNICLSARRQKHFLQLERKSNRHFNWVHLSATAVEDTNRQTMTEIKWSVKLLNSGGRSVEGSHCWRWWWWSVPLFNNGTASSSTLFIWLCCHLSTVVVLLKTVLHSFVVTIHYAKKLILERWSKFIKIHHILSCFQFFKSKIKAAIVTNAEHQHCFDPWTCIFLATVQWQKLRGQTDLCACYWH